MGQTDRIACRRRPGSDSSRTRRGCARHLHAPQRLARGENYEFDIIAHNGDEIVVVEVKTTLRVKHVNRFLERLDRVKNWLPEYKNARIYGAVAFLRAEEESEAYAERQRLFVIRATGDSAAIVNQPGFEPRAF
jgi:Holliday junction resolvase-like predicted endonuclease